MLFPSHHILFLPQFSKVHYRSSLRCLCARAREREREKEELALLLFFFSAVPFSPFLLLLFSPTLRNEQLSLFLSSLLPGWYPRNFLFLSSSECGRRKSPRSIISRQVEKSMQKKIPPANSQPTVMALCSVCFFCAVLRHKNHVKTDHNGGKIRIM